MDIWGLIEVEKALQNKTLKEFKSWIAKEMAKEDTKTTQHQQKEVAHERFELVKYQREFMKSRFGVDLKRRKNKKEDF